MSGWIVPVCIVAVVIYALCKRVNVYQAFVEGAAEAIPLLLKILPFMAAMLIAIELLRASGLLEDFTRWAAPVLEKLGLPAEVVPLVLLRPFSGSAATAMVSDIMANSGPDSFESYLAGILMGSSETIFYTLALYFGSVGVIKTRYTLPVALISMAAGVAASVLLARWMW